MCALRPFTCSHHSVCGNVIIWVQSRKYFILSADQHSTGGWAIKLPSGVCSTFFPPILHPRIHINIWAKKYIVHIIAAYVEKQVECGRWCRSLHCMLMRWLSEVVTLTPKECFSKGDKFGKIIRTKQTAASGECVTRTKSRGEAVG